MDVLVCSTKVYFLYKYEFWMSFDKHDWNHTEYNQEAEFVEIYL